MRSPFREEHLVVVPNFFWGIYANSEKTSPFCPLSYVPCPVMPPPIGVIGGQWCCPGTIGQLVHIVWLCTHIYGISAKTSPFCPCPMSRHAPPCRGYWWPMVLAWDNWSIGPYCLAMYTYIWHLSQDVPLLPLSHVPSRPPL